MVTRITIEDKTPGFKWDVEVDESKALIIGDKNYIHFSIFDFSDIEGFESVIDGHPGNYNLKDEPPHRSLKVFFKSGRVEIFEFNHLNEQEYNDCVREILNSWAIAKGINKVGN